MKIRIHWSRSPHLVSARMLLAAVLSLGSVLALMARVVSVHSQNRDVAAAERFNREDSQTGALYGQSRALVIGASKYTKGWRNLPGVEKDIDEIKTVLEDHGFGVDVLKNPSRAEFDAGMRGFIKKWGHLPHNRLLIYFAGHGHTLKASWGGMLGYMVPANAPLPTQDEAGFKEMAVSMNEIEGYARQINSKHALFVFDSCFSGSIFSENMRAAPGPIGNKAKLPVRQFLTAGTAEQAVPDQSIFKQYFVKALKGGADVNPKDGYVTGGELGEYIYNQVTRDSRVTQTPRFGTLLDPMLSQGDFVFIVPLDDNLTPAQIARCEGDDNPLKKSFHSKLFSGGKQDEALWLKALEIHCKAYVIDGHNDITSIMYDDNYDLGTPSDGKYHTDIPRMKQGGLVGMFFSIYVDRSYASRGGSTTRALNLIDAVRSAAEKYPDDIMVANSTDDIRRAKHEGKIAALMGIEGGHAIEGSLATLRTFYSSGVRSMMLTHNNTNDWADACCDTAKHNGLSDFGKKVIREMNRLGMLVDVSHAADKTIEDALDVSTAPIIASHSSARALANRTRNIPDEQLRRIAKKGGIVMITFYPIFIDQKAIDASAVRDARLKPQRDALIEQFKNDTKRLEEELNKLNAANPLPPTPLSLLVDHIDHVAKVAGIEHVGIGSGFDSVPYLPVGMEDVGQLPNLTYELLRRGYKEQDIYKILGGNFMRVFSEVERVARTTSKAK